MAGSSISSIRCGLRGGLRLLRAAKFEPFTAARKEDRRRAQSLCRKTVRESSLIDQERAELLSQMLRERTAESLASKVYMRQRRKHVAIGLLDFFTRWPPRRLASFTIVSKHWHVAPENLMALNVRQMLRALRSDLNRCGAKSASGCLIAFVDLEFEPKRKLFVVHVHGLVTEQMIDVLYRLRTRPKYQTVRREMRGVVPVYRPIMLKQLNISGLLKSITYVFKSHWTARWRRKLDAGGKFSNPGRRQRISEPFHSLMLLWFDRHSFSDATLMMGMEAGATEFRKKRGR
jgi:hypothetical protein